MTVEAPCFRFEELDWIAALIERLRSGDVGAIETLVGTRTESAPAAIGEEPLFVLRGVGPTRLRLLALVGAGAAATLVASRWGLLG